MLSATCLTLCWAELAVSDCYWWLLRHTWLSAIFNQYVGGVPVGRICEGYGKMQELKLI